MFSSRITSKLIKCFFNIFIWKGSQKIIFDPFTSAKNEETLYYSPHPFLYHEWLPALWLLKSWRFSKIGLLFLMDRMCLITRSIEYFAASHEPR